MVREAFPGQGPCHFSSLEKEGVQVESITLSLLQRATTRVVVPPPLVRYLASLRDGPLICELDELAMRRGISINQQNHL